uniref:Peptidase S1 domain-containing protein n=1 Tax=Glossina palpalis gambiensis TaxID=67801 RepID=A0A1B0C0H9_9MUSC
MFLNWLYIYFIAICIFIIKDHQVSAEECNEDLKEFENDTINGKYIVWVYCKADDKEVLNIGVILSKDAILTANSLKMDGIKCSAHPYSPLFDGKTTNQDMISGLVVATYGNVNEVLPHWTLPHLKLILLERELSLGLEQAQTISFLEKDLNEKSACVIPVPNAFKLFDRKTEIVGRTDCELAYPGLHRDIICVRTPIEYCNIDHCTKYNVEGAPLICDGIFAGLVTKDGDQCDATKPCLIGKVLGSQQWIESSMNLLNRDNEFKTSTIYVTFLAENDRLVHVPGVIIADDIVLTSAVLTNTSAGFVFDRDGEKIAWNSAINYANNWPAESDKLQLGVIALEKILDPERVRKMNISKMKPIQDDECVLAIIEPYWVKLEVNVSDDDKCRAALPKYHEDYMCVRPKLDGVQFGVQIPQGTPIICSGELAGITARIEGDHNGTLYPFVPMHRMNDWIGASEMALHGDSPKTNNSLIVVWLSLLFASLECKIVY